ncbi:unnamed protein product [Gongylonema pulchrum]|uniref:Secreted protein n=1 Tax=Gongylonema pulchrum TaxID=637853 RepID=A0A183CWU1_9BILA|nr:unnamed protein product [Gongylonema pulchrum]
MLMLDAAVGAAVGAAPSGRFPIRRLFGMGSGPAATQLCCSFDDPAILVEPNPHPAPPFFLLKPPPSSVSQIYIECLCRVIRIIICNCSLLAN